MSLLNDRVYDTNVGKTGFSLDRVRELFHGTVKVLEKEGSPFHAGVEDNCHWFTTGFEVAFFNQVSIYNGDPEIFEKALERFYELGLVHTVFLGGAALVHGETLKTKGYVNRGAVPLMGYALDPIKDQHQLRPGLEVKRVVNAEDLQRIQVLMSDGFEMPVELVESYSENSLGIADSFRYYLLDNGVPVSTSHFMRIGTFLGCWDVATPKEHQRKGYGDELMRWVFATHAALGDDLVVLQASNAGQPLYRRTGYQFLEYIQGWQMDDKALMQRFTHKDLQLGEFTLRQLVEADSTWLIPFWNDEAVQKWMSVPAEFGEKEFTSTLARFKAMVRNGTGINWVVERDGVPVAMLACHSTDWKLKATEIGFATIPAHRGQGIMPAVLAQLGEFLLEQYGFERIEIQADTANAGSRRTAEKAGFTFEGELRRRFLNNGALTDDAVYSMIKDDLTR